MKTVANREFKNRLGRYLKMVTNGETLAVTNRGKVVARVVPPEHDGRLKTVDDVLDHLEAQGYVQRARGSFKGRKFKPVVTSGKPASQMILEDRE